MEATWGQLASTFSQIDKSATLVYVKSPHPFFDQSRYLIEFDPFAGRDVEAVFRQLARAAGKRLLDMADNIILPETKAIEPDDSRWFAMLIHRQYRGAETLDYPKREVHFPIDEAGAASCLACLELATSGIGDKSESAGMVPQSSLPWPATVKKDKDRRTFLDGHKADIPNKSVGRRRMVDAAAFISYWDKRGKAGFESLDLGDAEPIIVETITAGEYLENIVPLLQQVAGTKQKKRQRKP